MYFRTAPRLSIIAGNGGIQVDSAVVTMLPSFRQSLLVSITNLFLVCRDMREHAQATLFAFNRFIITSSSCCHILAESTPARLEVSLFLLDVMPRTALYWLRFLKVVIPPFDEDYFRAHEPAHQEWLQTIDHVKGKLKLPSLIVRIYMIEWKSNGS